MSCRHVNNNAMHFYMAGGEFNTLGGSFIGSTVPLSYKFYIRDNTTAHTDTSTRAVQI